MKRLLPAIIFLFLACKSEEQKNKEHVDSLVREVSEATDNLKGKRLADSILKSAKEDALKNGSWEYSEEENKMTSDKNYFASLMATNILDLNFPYNGGVYATITIRKKEGATDAILSVSKGQFMTHADDEKIRVRFDQKKAETFYCSQSSDGDSRYLFISGASRFIAHLKGAKFMIIEAELYDNGIQQMEFNTEGFEWRH